MQSKKKTKMRCRRRRECLRCSKRFTTYEVIEDVPIIVIKKDKSREVFDRNKILKGMLRACEKRSVTINELETAISEIEATLQSAIDREVTSSRIGELIMEKLKNIDEVALCFAAFIVLSVLVLMYVGKFSVNLRAKMVEEKNKVAVWL